MSEADGPHPAGSAGNGGSVEPALLLGEVPLFAALTADERQSVASLCTERTFRRGDVVFREGEPSTSCFVVVSGEVEVTTGLTADRGASSSAPVQVRRLGPGEIFGEIGVLLGRARTATVTATRPLTALELPADELRHVVTENPHALQQVSLLLAARLVATTRGDRSSSIPRVVMVTGEPRVKGRSFVAATLAGILADVTDRSTAWVELTVPRSGHASAGLTFKAIIDAPADAPLDEDPRRVAGVTHLVVDVSDGAPDEATLVEAIERLRARFTFVIVDVGASSGIDAATAGPVGDAIVHVSHRTALPPSETPRLVVLNLNDHRAHPLAINHNEPFVLRREERLLRLAPHVAAERALPNHRSPAGRTLRRVAHTLLGTTVGVALGGGAAFGLAHVGVLEVLDGNDIPVDLVVGTSMGSIVATGYAAGIDSAEMHVIAERVGKSFRTLVGLVNPNPMSPGLLSGRKLQGMFNPILGSAETFDDLVVPCRTVAADVESGERVCIGAGRLEDAFRASSSIPMLIAPWMHNGHILVDGAMVDPVPAEVAREMGADLVIAVNVVPHLRKGITTVVSRVTRGVSNFNPLSYASRTRGLPNFVDTAMNTIQTLQHELGHFKAASADVRINPDLADITWIEFYRAPAIIERGQKAAEEALPAVRRVLDERLAAALPD